jgi:hypothetical protein
MNLETITLQITLQYVTTQNIYYPYNSMVYEEN